MESRPSRRDGWYCVVLQLGLFGCFFCSLHGDAVAQEAEAPPSTSGVHVSGSIAVTNDLYDFAQSPDSLEPARRPPSLTRLIFSPTITIGDVVSLPFSITLSSRETNFITPITENPTFLQFIENPLNNLGFISFSPRIGWAQAFIGTHTPQYSELSTGDEQILGLGFDLKPGDFRFAASGGTSQRAIEPDSAKNIRGAYARRLYMAKLGYGKEEESFFTLNFVRMKDDASSISTHPSGVDPEEGVLFSANFASKFSEHAKLTGEFGVSGFTQNVESDPIDAGSPIPNSLLSQRISTRADYAGTLAFLFNQSAWGFRTSGTYIGAGYVALGYPYMQPDKLEFLLAPRVALFESKLNLNGSIGYRTNNLSGTKGTTSSELIGSINALATITEAFSLSAQYANFGVRNTETNDTLKVQTVSNSFSISPTYVITTSSAVHNITLTYSLDQFTDYNVVSGAEGSNNTQNIMALYAIALQPASLSGTVLLGHLKNHLPTTDLAINTLSLQLSYAFFEGKLVPSAGVQYSETEYSTSLATLSPDTQTLFRVGVQWNITKKIALRVAGSSNNYRYGGEKPGASFVERLLESSISTQF